MLTRPLIFLALLTTIARAATLDAPSLQSDLDTFAQSTNGRLGVFIAVPQGHNASLNPNTPFPLQSVMKFPLALAFLEAVDQNKFSLDDPVVVRPENLSLHHQPLAALVTPKGYPTTLRELLQRAVAESDNAAADLLLEKIGGPATVQDFLNRHHLAGLRVDRDERHLQPEIDGLTWRPELSTPEGYQKALATVPEAAREAAFKAYLADPRDTSTPLAMAQLLASFSQGQLLSPASTALLLQIMADTSTGPDRLKAGLPKGWSLAHKTGSSGAWKNITAATNDVGILTAPDGTRLVIVAFLAESKASDKARAATLAHIAKLTVQHYHPQTLTPVSH